MPAISSIRHNKSRPVPKSPAGYAASCFNLDGQTFDTAQMPVGSGHIVWVSSGASFPR
jgi:hypothetical protein